MSPCLRRRGKREPFLATAILVAFQLRLASAAHFYESGSDVVVLKTKDDFRKKISNSSFLWFLQLYREGCGFCKLLEPEYERVAAELKHIVHFASLDVERFPQLSGAVTKKYGFSVEGVPTVRMILPGKLQTEDYRGERTAKAMKAAAYQAMPSFVDVATPAGLDAWLSRGAADARSAVLFSAKGSVPPLFKAVSSAYRGHIRFAQVTIADLSTASGAAAALAKRFELSQLPTLVVLKRDADDFEAEKWVAEKFGERAFASLTFGAKEKPSFRRVEGWLMGYGRAARTTLAKGARARRRKGDAEL
eukprot:TRINITY_DN49434_c0_g1_i1.p1 TRINITY_DN49434_c0_g1~~TRINITY_DN49434_c0_g1_i1.p1  ORF type:complete len:305 (-),score=83.38 TRINITY_DN49434_c0_g1_i1:57-971(-)